jgi:hypothetical protein
MITISFLCTSSANSINDLEVSNLASQRMRILPAVKAIRNKSIKVHFGEFLFKQSKFLVICKIGSHDICTRSATWLSEIISAKSRGSFIFLDYTDHHLGFDGPMTHFYQSALELADHCIVPSTSMAKLLSNFWNGPISVIEDAIEVTSQPVKVNLVSNIPTALWFGHASNISFLVDFINSSEFLMSGCNLIVLSNDHGIDLFSRSSLLFINPQQIRLGLWSVETMLNAACVSDFSIIPSDLSNSRKLGVSSNRLITSFALGLPTAADLLPSYQEFSDCFIDIRGPLFSMMVDNPLNFSNLATSAQSLYVDRFKPDSIGRKWLTLFTDSPIKNPLARSGSS